MSDVFSMLSSIDPLTALYISCAILVVIGIIIGATAMYVWSQLKRKVRPSSILSQSGNVFFALFGAVGLVGVIGAASMSILKGPVAGMQKVTKYTVAENAMIAGGRLSLVAASQQAGNGDCDNDGFIEPVPWATGAGTPPAGGGFIPASLGAARQDPWGTTYGYCVWDHGPQIAHSGCGGAAQKRLRGTGGQDKAVIAIIAAGPDRVFQTTCGNDPDYVSKPGGSDDVVLSYSYAEAGNLGGGLWNMKSGDPATAEIAKNLEVKNSGGDVVFGVDSTTDAGRPAIKVDFIQKLSAAKKGVEFLSNIILGGAWLSGDGDNEGIQIGATGNVSMPQGARAGGLQIGANAAGAQVDMAYPSESISPMLTARNLRLQSGGAVMVHTGMTGSEPDGDSKARLTILPDGTIGVGTVTPTQRLHVAGGNALVNGEVIATGAASNQFRAVGGNFGSFIRNDGSNTYWLLTNSGDAYGTWNTLRPFYFNNTSGNAYIGGGALSVLHGGNVGIGTGTPSMLLHVNGAGRIGDIKIGSEWHGALWPGLSNVALSAPGTYALIQNAAGQTLLNSAAGQSTSLRINNASIMEIAGTGITANQPLTMAGTTTINMNNSKILNLGAPSGNTDAATKKYVDDTVAASGGIGQGPADTRYVNVTGDTMTGALDMSNAKITSLATPTAAADAATKAYVDSLAGIGQGAADTRYVNVTGDTMTGALAMGNNKVTGLATPTAATDATTKAYVDAAVADGGGMGQVCAGAWQTGKNCSGTAIASQNYVLGEGCRTFCEKEPGTTCCVNRPNGEGHWRCDAYNGPMINDAYGPSPGVLACVGDHIQNYVRKAGDTMTGNLMFTGGARYVGTSDANNLVFRTNNTDRVILASAGNVGIGVNPTSKLHVGGQVDVSSNKIINVAMPTANLDAANKQYVDEAVTNAIDVSCGSDCTTGPIGSLCSDGAIYIGRINGKRTYIAQENEGELAWMPYSSTHCNPQADSETDGVENTDRIMAAKATRPNCGDKTFPAAEACRSKGAKWYLPVYGEILHVSQVHSRTLLDIDFPLAGDSERFWTSRADSSIRAWAANFTTSGGILHASETLDMRHSTNNSVRCFRHD